MTGTVTTPTPGRSPKKRAGGIVVPHVPKWYQRIGAWAIYALVRVVSATIRFRWHDGSGHFFENSPGPSIYCIWHNRLPLCMTAYYEYIRKRSRACGLAAMVSASKDGGFLAAILECFKVQPVRGSSSRRGPQALLELVTWAERNHDLAITPDGPRGPCYVVQHGVMSLAQVTGLPIIPVGYDVNWKIRLRSWDRFMIPLPFAACNVRIGRAMRVPRDASDEERERLRQQLETALKDLSRD